MGTASRIGREDIIVGFDGRKSHAHRRIGVFWGPNPCLPAASQYLPLEAITSELSSAHGVHVLTKMDTKRFLDVGAYPREAANDPQTLGPQSSKRSRSTVVWKFVSLERQGTLRLGQPAGRLLPRLARRGTATARVRRAHTRPGSPGPEAQTGRDRRRARPGPSFFSCCWVELKRHGRNHLQVHCRAGRRLEP